jgi:hypothetical protein
MYVVLASQALRDVAPIRMQATILVGTREGIGSVGAGAIAEKA